MEGLKRRLNESIQLRLSFILSLVILIVAVAAGVFSFMAAFDEAHGLQDDVLRQVAQLMVRQRLSPTSPATDARLKGNDEKSRVIAQRLGERNPSPAGADAGGSLLLPPTLADGLHTLEAGGETFRVMIKTTAAGERIAVAQASGLRNEIVRDGALRTVTPFLILVPVLLLVVAGMVRKMFRPMATLSREIDKRAEQELHPIEESHLPTEVLPFVVAINRMLARVARSMDSQRRFVADAAHELRSPLTALSLQAERLAQAEMSGPARERLAALRRGIERGSNLLDQLLTLAKAQSSSESPSSPVSIHGIYRRVLEDLMPLAEARHIDIGIEGAEDARAWVNELDMIAVVKNLVDNAIRYTPQRGRVDLSVSATEGRVVLRIRDNGPGIPLAERDQVFAPFYRALGSEQIGSGLGLAIVQTIVSHIGAEIRLEFSDEAQQTGLSVAISIPLADASRAAGPLST
ncbi:sensor histidine kinase [Caballeronia sp. KNU42]